MPSDASYPQLRMRRLRQTSWVRALVQDTQLAPTDFIYPMFICDGKARRSKITNMPGLERYSVDLAIGEARKAARLGIPAIALFPQTPPAKKTPDGREALNPDNLICRAVRAIKAAVPTIGILCDVALDPYTTHGHDGLLEHGEILNDATVDVLVQQALNQVEAGCDIIAPSDMMDGRIGAIRAALEQAGHTNTLLMAYSAKYASALYGPFREAVGSASALKGDKRSYQMNPGNKHEAMRELALDVAEGADMIMVKPGLLYLDIVHAAATRFDIPVFAYQVSGEYAMLARAAQLGMDANAVMLESLLAFKRAGATGILTYFALAAAQALQG